MPVLLLQQVMILKILKQVMILKALTPNQFVLGRANICIPFIFNAEVYSNHRKMFRSCQAYADMIWQRWVGKYLSQKNFRSQCNKSQTKIENRDLVWLNEDNVKRSQYRMARIVEIYPGKDGVVRSALIKTLDDTLERPMVKVAPLINERFPSENEAGLVGASNIFRV